LAVLLSWIAEICTDFSVSSRDANVEGDPCLEFSSLSIGFGFVGGFAIISFGQLGELELILWLPEATEFVGISGLIVDFA